MLGKIEGRRRRVTEDEIFRWHHRLNGHEFEQTLGASEGQGNLECRESVWGTPPVAKVMRKEAQHMQRRDRASGVPLEILEHLPSKPESAYFTALCSHLHLWLYGGLSPNTSLWKRVNLQLQLIKFLGVIAFEPTNSYGSPLACLNRFFRPHVIAQSLTTVRGRRCSKLSKHRFLWAVKRLIRNCTLVKGFSLVGPVFAAKSPYSLPTVSLAVYWWI